MTNVVGGPEDTKAIGAIPIAITKGRSGAWALIALADIGLLLWAALATLAPERLIGPNSTPILPAGYEGFTGYSWQQLVETATKAAEYATLLFRMFGLYGVGLSLLAIAIAVNAFRRAEVWAWWALLVGNSIAFVGAMAYDQIVRAVGPFELSEYLGLALIYGSLAITAPWWRGRSPANNASLAAASRP